MAGFERMTINMTGGGPWGFRLFGGDSEPLVIAKLRKRSKAAEAGLEEGDKLISINGYSCKNTSHPVAMGLVDQGGSNLSFDIIRGTADQNVVDAAFQESGGQLKPIPASVRPQGSAPAFKPSQITNGYEPKTSVSRQREVYSDGNTTTEVSMETSTEQFGSTTLTKTTRQTKSSSQWGTGAPEPAKPLFAVSDNTGTKSKPGVWQPGNPGGAPPRKISAPSGVQMQHNPDQSLTMTIGLGGDFGGSKENIAPRSEAQPMFKVPKVTQQNKPGTWQPSAVPAPISKPAPVAAPAFQPEYSNPVQSAAPIEHMDLGDDGIHEGQFHLAKMLHDNAMDTGRDSPNIRRRIAKSVMDACQSKKIFADSAFYDDPEHKYPTIEEQIKMARKVALSLIAPANMTARGHTMFVKRQERSDKWTTEFPGQKPPSDEVQEKKYFHPDPFNPKHTWQPPKATAHLHNAPISHWEDPDKPVPSAYKAPVLPLGLLNDIEKREKTNALSAEEFERMRLYEQKVQHNLVSPQVSFSLADDLKNMRGKGGKLFAKRKARVEKFVQESDDSPSQPRNMTPDFLNKLTGGMMPPPNAPVMTAPKVPGGPPTNRLKAMIDPPKAPMTPWDAVAEHGDVERAFSHIDGYLAQKNTGSFKHQIAKNLDTKAKGPPPAPIYAASGPAVMPEFTRVIKPWEGDSTDLRIIPKVSATGAKPRFGGTNSSKPTRPWSTIEDSSGSLLNSTPASALPASSVSNQSAPASGAKPFKAFNSNSVPSTGAAGASTQKYAEVPKPSGFRSVKFNVPNESAGVFGSGSAPWRKDLSSKFSASSSPSFQASPLQQASPASSSVDNLNIPSPAGSLSRVSPHGSHTSEARDISEADGYCDL